MIIKFPGSTGTRSHTYSVMGYGENTHAKTLIYFHKQLITTSHNKSYKYLTEILENIQGFQFARTCSQSYK